jgi:flagellar hook protein FlgE
MLSIIMSGLNVAQKDLSVTANNLANANTVGYKKSNANFVDVFANDPSANPKTAVGAGAMTDIVARDTSQGAMSATGRATDLAIAGQGYFVLNASDNGTPSYVFTRAGSFGLDAEGNLVNSTGARVQVITPGQDADGNPIVPNPAVQVDGAIPTTVTNTVNGVTTTASLQGISINAKGLIAATYSDNSIRYPGFLAVANFPNSSALKAIGNSNYIATGDSGAAVIGSGGAPNAGDIMSATLEQSNVDITQELMKMLRAQQLYNGNARMLQTSVEVSSRLTDKI